MFKKLLTFIAVIAIVFVLVMPAPADAALRHYKLYVYKAITTQALFDVNRATRLTDDVYYSVYRYHATTPSATRETLYSDKAGTALASNPWVLESVFDDTGTIDFYCDPNETSDKTVKILVIDAANGKSTWADVAFDKDHTVIIDERPGVTHLLTLPLSSTCVSGTSWGGAANNSDAVDTGIDFPLQTAIFDAFVNVTTASASASTLDSGYLASSTAFISGQETFTVGLQHDTVFDTAFQFITTDSTYQSIYYTWSTDSVDGWLNFIHTNY